MQCFRFLQIGNTMDDIYFSDKKRKRNPNDQPSPDRITDESGMPDETFELKFRNQGNAQMFSPSVKRFAVNIPDDNDDAGAQVSKPSQQNSRVPQGRIAPQDGRVPQGRVAPQVKAAPQAHTPSAQKSSATMPNAGAYSSKSSAPQTRTASQNPRIPQGRVNPQNPRTPQGRVASPAPKKTAPSKTAPKPKKGMVGEHHKPPERKSPKGKIVLGVLCLFVILFGALFLYGYSALGGLSYTELEDENAYIDESELLSDSGVRNILFIGSDEREGLGGQRSDSMILFSIDSNNKKIKLTSFMRDSYVYIPSKGYKTRLNAAFNYGGAQLLIDTLEYNFHIKIDDYIMINYDVFIDFVNLLGGITIDGVTEAEAKYMREQVNRPKFKEGTNTMDGRTAMWYCRIRYVDDDFHRTQRQRKVLTAIINTAAKTNLFKLVDIVKQVLPNISTNMEKNDLLGLGIGAIMKYLRYDIVQQQIPAPKTWENRRINGQDVLAINLEKNQEILADFIYGEDSEE